MLTVLALLGVLLVGLTVGLLWHGAVLIGDRRVLDRLTTQIEAEHRMRAATYAALRAMRQAATSRGRWDDDALTGS